MTRDYRDVVIEELADSEALLLERVAGLTLHVASLEEDMQSYRMLAQEGIHALHTVTKERDRLREQLARLRDEFRWVREKLLRQAAA